MDGAVVDESDSGGKSGLLDKQLLSGEAADTHTHTHGARHLSNGGCGCSENRKTGTNQTPYHGNGLHDVLALEMPGESNGLERTPFEGLQPEGTSHRRFNPDPRVADYENAEEVMELWLNA